MTIRITHAVTSDVDALVSSVAALFAEDGGTHDPYMDTSWPDRHGAAFYAGAINDTDSLVLLAKHDDAAGVIIGHLVDRLKRGNPLRPHAVTAILESMRVTENHRRQGTGSALIAEFLRWSDDHGANQAIVTAFAANDTAMSLYQAHSFAPFEMTLHRPL
ncbi:GNAT family N-acetyltransferase [Amycolatopsis antarctica]|uniref:GNAT family N-acetyltransferase n=1 Tax=Amycolatopsis antarctica TaxID=1854586 RepID=A0A263CWZ9_9PSEU|nr:GNAT family N-acetyltransferase [Amycolatopsis antarctica]OZM70662.1 GNAT family N-acetyltransferase [Amycolatopsis antarctica]